jgi:hypothetical protein
MGFRLLFHSLSFENSRIAEFLYFGGNDMALIGLFSLLYYQSKGILKRLVKISLIYSFFCLGSDILMLLGIGAHDYGLFTAISISILALGTLWEIFA